VVGQSPQGCLEGRHAEVVEVAGHSADKHPRHTHDSVPSAEEIDAKSRVVVFGETAADIADVVVQPRGLVDDDHARMGSGSIGEGQVRILE